MSRKITKLETVEQLERAKGLQLMLGSLAGKTKCSTPLRLR